MIKRPTLFFKIFAGFWFICCLIFAALFFTIKYFESANTPPDFILEKLYTFKDKIEAENITNTRQFLTFMREQKRQQPREYRLKAVVLDDKGEHLGPQRMPGFMKAVVKETFQHTSIQLVRTQHHIVFGPLTVELPLGTRTFYFHERMAKPPQKLMLIIKQHPWFVVTIILAISGLCCFLLARHIVAPVHALMAQASKLSQGDLSARMTGKSLKRFDEFASLSASFNEMANALEHNMDEHKRLLASISHELRSPITRINIAKGLSDRILHNYANALPADIQQKLERYQIQTEDELTALNEMIAQLLNYSKNRLLVQSSQPQAFDLISVTKHVVDQLTIESNNLHKTLIFQTELEDTLISLPIEESQLKSAISNIIRNAIDFASTTIEVTLEATNKGCKLVVKDDGQGVPDNEIDKILMPFYRVSVSRTRQTGGVGMGLAITQSVVEQCGGKLEIINVSPQGLQVTAYFNHRG